MTTAWIGGCACGKVRYELSGEPLLSLQCQCRDCQRATGSGHVNAMGFPETAVKLSGELRFHDVRADSGHTVSRGFCPECGAPVMFKFSRNPQLRAIIAGSLDDPCRFSPQMVVYASRGHPWDHLDPALPKYEAGPPQGARG